MIKTDKTNIKVVEDLLRNYKPMKAEQSNLKLLYDMLEKQKEGAIYSDCLTSSFISDMPFSINYNHYDNLISKNNEEYNNICDQQSFITIRLEDLYNIITAIENSLNSLIPINKNIILQYYCERMTLDELSKEFGLARNWIHKLKYIILEEMYKSLYIFKNKVLFIK
jgi:hypothetical protein